jgi:hypothetical protein
LKRDDEGRFHITERGKLVLECLDGESLPALDIAYSQALERDLQSIERGEASAEAVIRKHPAALPGSTTAAATASPRPPFVAAHAAAKAPAFRLPTTLDPAERLPHEHSLRTMKAAMDEAELRCFGAGIPEGREASRRRAARAAALGAALHCSVDEVIERLQFDLALRWVVGIDPTVPVWQRSIFDDLVAGMSGAVARLAEAARHGRGQSGRRPRQKTGTVRRRSAHRNLRSAVPQPSRKLKGSARRLSGGGARPEG